MRWIPALAGTFLLALLACGGSSSQPAPQAPPAPPQFTTQPADQSVPQGQTATFTVAVSGNPTPTLQWERSNNGGGSWAAVTGGSGGQTVAYTTAATVAGDNGAQFRAVASSPQGHATSNPAHLAVTAPVHYEIAYASGLQGHWTPYTWEDAANPIGANFAAAAPGGGRSAIHVQFGAANGWNAFGLGNWTDWNHIWELYLNQFRTVEFDVYFEPGCTGVENLAFILSDAGRADDSRLVDHIPGWASLTTAQRYGTWLHARVNLLDLHPKDFRFFQFLLFNAAGGDVSQPRFYLADVKLNWVDDATAPAILPAAASLNPTYTQLTLPFTTDEPTHYRVDYGTSTAYGTTLQGGTTEDDWAETYSVVLAGLTPGTTCYYRITATDHQFLASATPNQGVSTGSFAVPPIPTLPPILSVPAVTHVDGCSATLTWTTDRVTSASVVYQKAGSAAMTRTLADLAAARTFVLDLLQPSSSYSVTVTATDAFGLVSSPRTLTVDTTTGGTPDVTVTLDPLQTRPISPYVYGLNFSGEITDAPAGVTFDRAGGNRWTAYNWENNASNAGSDYLYESDAYLSSSSVPGEAVRSLVAADQSRHQASLVTFQMQGYAAADKNGPVPRPYPNLSRFKLVVPRKGSAFTATPSTSDTSVYMDEFAWALDQKLPGLFSATAPLPTFISLDNEPELWPSTHEEIQGTAAITSDAYIAKTIALTRALKDQFPDVQLFGPVHYGFNGISNWQGEAGLNATPGGNDWFTNKYLAALKTASDTYGKRLLDVYDIHWYSEATSTAGARITNLLSPTLTADEVQAVVQSPRSLWDPTYTENSWIARWMGGPVNILGRLQSRIDHSWPGTKIAITEYESGGDNHIAGALAQADNLGVFGDQGVFAATWWAPNSTYPYTLGAYRMYRGFDGAGALFGDTALKATSSNVASVSVHASLDSQVSGRVVFVAINRSTAYQEVALEGQPLAGTAYVYRITAESGAAQVASHTPVAPVLAGQVPVNGSSFLVLLPPMSVSTIEVR